MIMRKPKPTRYVDCAICGERFHDEDIRAWTREYDTVDEKGFYDEGFDVCKYHTEEELATLGKPDPGHEVNIE